MNMNKIKVTTYTLPAYWATALINGDFSGTSQEDIDAMDKFLTEEQPGSCVGCSAENWFAHTNDATNVGCEVAKYTFYN